MMRNAYRALTTFETTFEQEYSISLNEAMVLCALREAKSPITSTTIALLTEMATSHTSKVIRSVEAKELIQRSLGETDKRQMYFSLTKNGEERLKELDLEKVEIPELLQPLFDRSTSNENSHPAK